MYCICIYIYIYNIHTDTSTHDIPITSPYDLSLQSLGTPAKANDQLQAGWQ